MGETYEYESIGVIHTSFESPEGMPIQPAGESATEGTVELEPAYADGLEDLVDVSHCILLYHFHETGDDVSLSVEPFLDSTERGLFATRAPSRPNPIGLSVVELREISGTKLTVGGVDVVDGTPLLDLKPFVPAFDVPADADAGWLEGTADAVRSTQADDRFC